MENSSDFLLSIIIATKNRQEFCALSVKQVYDVTDERVQIIVHDNSDDNSLESIIKKEKYSSRVEYYYVAEPLRVVENYNAGFLHARGEYWSCIGDDDGIFPQMLEATEFAKAHNIEAIRPNVGAVYLWPNVADGDSGKLTLGKHETVFRFANPRIHLERLLSQGGQGYLSLDLIKAYHGIVSRKLLDEVFRRTGKYCGALATDMYMCISLSLLGERVLVIEHPLTVSGACRQSESGKCVNKTSFGPLSAAPHFAGKPYEWSRYVPEFYCSPTIWADTAMRTFIEMGEDEEIVAQKFNIEKLTAVCLHNFPQFKSEIMDNFNRNLCSKEILNKYLREYTKESIINSVKSVLRKPYHMSKKLLGLEKPDYKQVFYGCNNIIEAEQKLRPLIDESFRQLLSKVNEYCLGEKIHGGSN